MGRAERIGNVGIILGALIRVLDQQANRRAGGDPFKYAGQYPDFIIFPALGGKTRSARFTPVQVRLHISGCQFQSGWTSVDDTAQCRAMAFAKAGYRKQFSN